MPERPSSATAKRDSAVSLSMDTPATHRSPPRRTQGIAAAAVRRRGSGRGGVPGSRSCWGSVDRVVALSGGGWGSVILIPRQEIFTGESTHVTGGECRPIPVAGLEPFSTLSEYSFVLQDLAVLIRSATKSSCEFSWYSFVAAPIRPARSNSTYSSCEESY